MPAIPSSCWRVHASWVFATFWMFAQFTRVRREGAACYFAILSSCWRVHATPRSRPCSLEEQYFKCGIFWDYDAPQRRVSNSEAPVLAGGIPVFLRGSQFSGASELKEGPVSTNWHKFLNVKSARRSWLPPRTLGTNAQCMERKGENNIFAKHAISLCKHKQDWSTMRNAILEKDLRRSLLVRNASTLPCRRPI